MRCAYSPQLQRHQLRSEVRKQTRKGEPPGSSVRGGEVGTPPREARCEARSALAPTGTSPTTSCAHPCGFTVKGIPIRGGGEYPSIRAAKFLSFSSSGHESE